LDQKEVLIKIAQMGALERYINLTTRELGTILGTSQQSASLYLQKLEADGYIKRIRRNRGTSVTITREGMDLLMGIFNQLKAIHRPDQGKVRFRTLPGDPEHRSSSKGYSNT
jgi:CTP-dependent riboflavin kinase